MSLAEGEIVQSIVLFFIQFTTIESIMCQTAPDSTQQLLGSPEVHLTKCELDGWMNSRTNRNSLLCRVFLSSFTRLKKFNYKKAGVVKKKYSFFFF